MPLYQFRIYSRQAFRDYIQSSTFARKITTIQNHHTWRPGYANITPARDEMYWLEQMRRSHINDRKWSDIGQNITTFPSGNIALCRPIDIKPAGIYGANTGGICIEHLGNFDVGGDVMTEQHKTTIIFLNALLCNKFGLAPVQAQVVYHHWFDTKGKRFPVSYVNEHRVGGQQKTCPGTGFFGGNTIADAEENFFPLISQEMRGQNNVNGHVAAPTQKRVNVNVLNVRTGPGKTFTIKRTVPKNATVSIYVENDGWSKISNNADEWVFTSLLTN